MVTGSRRVTFSDLTSSRWHPALELQPPAPPPPILLIFPLPTDFCCRAFQLESQVILVYSDTQGDDRGLRRPGWWERPRAANQRESPIAIEDE